MIDWTKPVQTKGDGIPVHILCTDGPGTYPVIGLVGTQLGPQSWSLDGRFDNWNRAHSFDLENVPQRTGFLLPLPVLTVEMETGMTFDDAFAHARRMAGVLGARVKYRFNQVDISVHASSNLGTVREWYEDDLAAAKGA